MAERKGRGHLYSEETKRDFERRYGKEHGDEVWRETIGKTAAEQAASSPGGVKREHVPGHISFSKSGTPFRVRPHDAYVHAMPHSYGHHGGKCGPECRRGIVPHKHRRGSSRRG